jgi:putative transposase
VRYRFVQKHQGQFPVTTLCRVMNISRSGFYAWREREPSERQQENKGLLRQIHHFFERSNQTYGSVRILRDLKEQGVACSRHRIARLMRQAGLRAVVAPRFQVTTDSKHALPVAQNLLARDFGASEVNVKWASDITYLWTGEGWLYLAVVLDLFSRRVVGWCMDTRLDRSLVINALKAAASEDRVAASQ